MNEEKFFHKIRVLYERMSALQANTSVAPEKYQQWLPVALEELNTAFEELQVAEEELRAQNEAIESARLTVEAERHRYLELFEFAPDGYLVTDKNGKIKEANYAATQLLNISQQFLVGKLLTSFLTQEARPVFRTALTQLSQGTQEQEWVVRLQPRQTQVGNLPEGSPQQEQPFDANLKLVAVYDLGGDLLELRCLIRDITERKQMIETVIQSRVIEATNHALKEEIAERQRVEAEREALLVQLDHKQRLLEAVLQQMPAGVTIADGPSGQIILANEESAQILGHRLPSENPRDSTKGSAVHLDGRPYDVDEYPQRRSRIFSEIVKGEEMHYRRGDGTQITLLVNTAPVRDPEGQIIATVGTFCDITERKQAERERVQLLAREQEARQLAEAANRMKDEFLSILSHEIRTPLSAMLGWSSLLCSRKFDQATTARALETIERNARSQARLIDDLLDVSQIIRGKLALDIRPVNLVSIIEATVETVRPAVEAKSIQFVSDLNPSAGLVLADGNRLQQVVWNLLSNAVKFTPEGGRVEISVQQCNSNTQIQVSDTGIGIRAEFLPYVFERFYQANSSATRSYKGLGLGLAIVRQLVELHGGTVQAESPGEKQGTTFTVTLPLRTSCTDRQGTPEINKLGHSTTEAVTLDSLPLNDLWVLVVDDEADTRNLIAMVLEQSGAKVMAVSSAADALRAIAAREAFSKSRSRTNAPNASAPSESQQFDVLLSDIGMPDEDGYTLIRNIRARSPNQGGQIPAVALTAYAREQDHDQALSAGFQVHMPKPVGATELIAVIVSLIRQTEKS